MITVGLLAFIAHSIDLQRILTILSETSLGLFFVAFCAMTVQALIAIERWRQVLAHQRVHLPFFSLLRFFWFGLFFNQLAPSSVGGDAVRAYCLVRSGCGIGEASISVLLDRMLGVLGLVALVTVCLPLSFQFIPNEGMRWGVALVAVGAMIGVFSVLFLDRLTVGVRRWRIVRGVATLSRDARRLLFSTGLGSRLVFLSVVVQLISVLAIAILAIAIRFEVHWVALLIVLPLATLLMTIPVSVAGWGVREGVVVVGLGYAGADAEQAAALSILFGLLVLTVALPGGALWLASDRRIEKIKASEAQ